MTDLRDALIEAVAEADRRGETWAGETMREAMAIADRRSGRRADVLKALRAELRIGTERATRLPAEHAAYVADYLTGHLAMFVLSLDDRTFVPDAAALTGETGDTPQGTFAETRDYDPDPERQAPA